MSSAAWPLERLVRFSHPCPMSRADPIVFSVGQLMVDHIVFLATDGNCDRSLNVVNDVYRRCQKQKHLHKIWLSITVNLLRKILKKRTIIVICSFVRTILVVGS